MRIFFKRTLIGLTICLGIAIVLETGLVLSWIVPEILQPTGSIAALINRAVEQVVVGAIAIAATVEVLFLGVLRSQRWMGRSLGLAAILLYGTIALLSLLLRILLS
jgi:hypothetical protein